MGREQGSVEGEPARQSQKGGNDDLPRRRDDAVAKSHVDLELDAGLFQPCQELHSSAGILVVLPY